MSFIAKKHLPRRTFLRGVGVTVALPLLDSMVPAQTPLARTAANPASRLSCIYVPHGATMYKWTPATEGSGFAFTETLTPLEKLRDRICVVSNLAHPAAGGAGSDAGADHARSAAVFLSGVHPERENIRVGPTIDQIVAQQLGQDTPLPSLELSIEDVALSCGSGYACAYSNTISWKTPTTPLPMENNPQVVFEKLFGDGSTNAAPTNEYLDDVREIERRIQTAQQHVSADLKLPEAPVGVPESFDEHFKIMFDLQVLAFRAETTRIATMMYARDTSGAVYPQSGGRDGFHVASHHGNTRANMDKYALINKYHVQMLAYFLGKLQATPDGDGNLLDLSMVLYGSSMSNGNQHDHDPLPLILAGGAAGQLQGGRHIQNREHTPMSNLLLSMLDKLGVHADQFGDSSGR